MNNKKKLKASHAQFALCTALLGALTACGAAADTPPTQQVYAQPPAAQATVVVQDDYVYYPGYEVYYSRNRHEYVYPEGGAWISRPAPRGVSVNVLLASPSIAVDFHDSPAAHHAAVVRQYPRNWTPPGPDHDQKHDQKSPQSPRKDDSHDYQHDNQGDRRDDHPQK